MTWSERRPRPGRERSAALALALAALVAGACSGGGDRLRLVDEVRAGRFVTAPAPAAAGWAVGLTLPAEPEVADVERADERRAAVVLPCAPWRWSGRVPRDGRLAVGVARAGEDASDRPSAAPLELRLIAWSDDEREVLEVGRRAAPGWLDVGADLAAYAGRRLRLEVEPTCSPAAPSRLAWSQTTISGPPPAADRPNVVFILVDTLRADRLPTYGYDRPTGAAIDRLLAARGTTMERAYAQAPWTVPSVISMMTGRYPGELLSGPIAGFRLPEGVPTLAERLADVGYETAAFYGNFVLRDANGFGRGFATRYTPPATPRSNFLHADAVNERAIRWLAAHREGPFFLYVHYMDPHDPYLAPELVDGRSPFRPDYSGRLDGTSVHGLYVGNVELGDPAEDVAHLSALYDSEVRTVDRAVEELVAALGPESAARTLFVFTADHGEELYERGGWKHGHTLYDEMVRAPLILRWDGRIPAGERRPETVELVDLVPTLLAAAGAPAEGLAGIDLLPALTDDQPLPTRPAFSENLASGPLRAAVALAGKKLILFNRERPFEGDDLHVAFQWRHDLERLARRELYDLTADPAERENLSGRSVGATAPVEKALERILHARLDRSLAGLRIRVSGLPAGSRLSGRIRLDRPPASWVPYFSSPQDTVSIEGREVIFEMVGEPGLPFAEKGLTLSGGWGRVESIGAWLDGAPLSPGRLSVGAGRSYDGAPLEAAELEGAWTPPPDGPSLRLWRRTVADPASPSPVDPEVERSLRALGYIQ